VTRRPAASKTSLTAITTHTNYYNFFDGTLRCMNCSSYLTLQLLWQICALQSSKDDDKWRQEVLSQWPLLSAGEQWLLRSCLSCCSLPAYSCRPAVGTPFRLPKFCGSPSSPCGFSLVFQCCIDGDVVFEMMEKSGCLVRGQALPCWIAMATSPCLVSTWSCLSRRAPTLLTKLQKMSKGPGLPLYWSVSRSLLGLRPSMVGAAG
jgi:hypothetical protein